MCSSSLRTSIHAFGGMIEDVYFDADQIRRKTKVVLVKVVS